MSYDKGSDYDNCVLNGYLVDGSRDFIGIIEFLYSKTRVDVPEEMRMIPSPMTPSAADAN